MSTEPIERRYLISFYQDDVCKHQYAALGIDDRAAAEAAKVFARENDGLDPSQFTVVSEARPVTVRLNGTGIKVMRWKRIDE